MNKHFTRPAWVMSKLMDRGQYMSLYCGLQLQTDKNSFPFYTVTLSDE